VPDRTRQSGGLSEVGVRIKGSGGAMELFAGLEKRLTPTPSTVSPSIGCSRLSATQ
jgi:hypothetical protein